MKLYVGIDRGTSAVKLLLVDGQGTTEPDPALTARYEEQYRKFRLIYPALKNIFPKIR